MTDLYALNDKEEIFRVNKLTFAENAIYLVIEGTSIYIWVGHKISKEKRNLSIEKANTLAKQKKAKFNIIVQYQNLEYGAFLAMMDKLSQNKMLDSEELKKFKEEKKDFQAQVKVASYFLWQKSLPYNDLAWLLAERQLWAQKGCKDVSKTEIKNRAEEIFNSSLSYDELTWLVAELDILISKKYCVVD